MNVKLKRALYILIPVGVVLGFVALLNKKKKPLDQPIEPGDADSVPSTVKTVPPPLYPIGQGSSGDLVKQVQQALGVTVDGQFGPKTQAALVDKMGVKTINSVDQLEQLKKLAAGVSNLNRANELVKRFNAGGVALFTIEKAPIEVINIDAFGAIIHSGMFTYLPANKLYNRTDYVLKGATKPGDLIFDITRGTLAGTYVVNPNLVTLK